MEEVSSEIAKGPAIYVVQYRCSHYEAQVKRSSVFLCVTSMLGTSETQKYVKIPGTVGLSYKSR